MGNILHEFFKTEEELEKHIENNLKEEDNQLIALYNKKKLVSEALEGITKLLDNEDFLYFTEDSIKHLANTETLLTRKLESIKRQMDLI